MKKIVYIKLTNRCQLNCMHCYNSVCDCKEDMSLHILWKSVEYVKELLNQGYIVDVSLHGGEPMLFPHKTELFKAILELKEAGAFVTATTNLVYHLSDDILDIFNLFVQQDGRKLLLTSYDIGIHRFEGDQRYLWSSNVKRLNTMGIKVQPIMTLQKLGMNYYKNPGDFFELLSYLGCSSCNFERLTNNGRAVDNYSTLMPTNEEVDTWLVKAYDANKFYNFMVPLFEGVERALSGEFLGCRARKCTSNVRTINPDGNIATCPNIPLDYIGSLNNSSEKYSKMQQHLNCSEVCRNQECYSCELFNICNGDCFQLGWDETGCPGMKKLIQHIRELKGAIK